jgi:peroxiredoxin
MIWRLTLALLTLAKSAIKIIILKGPVVLTWYRGGWCPYCNMTLHYLQEQLPNIQLKGANLLALTPELPDKSMSTVEKHELQFEVLSDVGNKQRRNMVSFLN